MKTLKEIGTYQSNFIRYKLTIRITVLHKRDASDSQLSLGLSKARQNSTRRGHPDVLAFICFVS
jgi:hypothetical protein